MPDPPPPTPDLLLFSDLDGTFLDDAFRPVLDGNEARAVFARWTVVWVSSRTADELLALQRALGHTDDAIGENGGVLLTHDHEWARAFGEPEPLDEAWVVRIAAPRDETYALVRQTFAHAGVEVHTLDELGPAEAARRSGYGVADAERALRRRTSVLLVDLDLADSRVRAALDGLRRGGATAVHGGRWVSVVVGADKGTTVRAWLAAWTARHGKRPRIVAGIGDADNDEQMLHAVALPFVVRRSHRGHAPALARIPGARLLERDGPEGWLEMLGQLDAITGDKR